MSDRLDLSGSQDPGAGLVDPSTLPSDQTSAPKIGGADSSEVGLFMASPAFIAGITPVSGSGRMPMQPAGRTPLDSGGDSNAAAAPPSTKTGATASSDDAILMYAGIGAVALLAIGGLYLAFSSKKKSR